MFMCLHTQRSHKYVQRSTASTCLIFETASYSLRTGGLDWLASKPQGFFFLCPTPPYTLVLRIKFRYFYKLAIPYQLLSLSPITFMCSSFYIIN